MTDLILHIGLPKTGTTTIQSKFLAGRINYLGQDIQNSCMSHSNKESEELRRLLKYSLWQSYKYNESQARQWALQCFELLQSHFASCENWPHTVILSDENLSKWPSSIYKGSYFPIITGLFKRHDSIRSRPAPIIRLLRDHGQTLWPFGRIRVVLTIRNQADWLASLYSQESDKISKVSNNDFRKRIEKIIKNDDPFLHWLYWIEDLEDILVNENLLVLPIEEIKTYDFWIKLAKFLDITLSNNIDFDTLMGKAENYRKGNYPQTWDIKNLNVRRALSQDQKVIQRFGIFFFFKKLNFIHYLISLHMNKKRISLLHLDDTLKKNIKSHYASSNEALALKLNKNLHDLGYF